MNYNGLVSVVMPVHNGEKYLREAINSVLNQTYSNFELLIIENCSSDSSKEIIKSFCDPRIKLIIEENCGQVQAYNRGFREANGEYIFIHDQDDISDHSRFKEQLNFFVENHLDICGSFYEIMNVTKDTITYRKLPINDSEIKEKLQYLNYVIFNPTVLISRKIFEKYGDFDLNYFPSADYEFYLRISKEKVRFGNLPKILYRWRLNPISISNTNVKSVFHKTKEISLKYSENNFDNYGYKFTEGLIYYYNNYLIRASLKFLGCMFRNYKFRISLRYFLLSFIFYLPLKILRKYKLTNTETFKMVKKKYYSLFN